MDAFTAFTDIDLLESEHIPWAAEPLPSTPESADSGVPVEFEYINNNYSHSWCTIA